MAGCTPVVLIIVSHCSLIFKMTLTVFVTLSLQDYRDSIYHKTRLKCPNVNFIKTNIETDLVCHNTMEYLCEETHRVSNISKSYLNTGLHLHIRRSKYYGLTIICDPRNVP